MNELIPPETSKEILGYLNFASGNRDPRFFQSLNILFGKLFRPQRPAAEPCTAVQVILYLEEQLLLLSRESEVFKVDDQAGLLLKLVRENLLSAYRQFHADLLFHQTDEHLFNPFFLAKIFETALKQGSPWTETDRIVNAVISELNDYIGYRPVPVLEGAEKHQPYLHEWVAPIPLYMDGIGIAAGRYEEVIGQALSILRETDPEILREACFDVDKLSELVLDSRAYDFDHPVNRKPNYHFGLWDPNVIDNDGFYRRFVVHQVTVDGILRRLETAYTGESEAAIIPLDELLYEAGAVLAGTMLMGSGVCGDSPNTYDSETSLTDLMPIIAGYRDRFYEQIVQKIPEKMKPRIQAEQQRLFQPFGGCRQDLNRQMAKRRADQLQRMHLARIFARMGYSEAAMKQASIISVASSRILTTIDCLITESHLLIDQGKLEEAAANLPKVEEYIRRGVSCGAIVDPWTILGFGGTFSLFHTVENSIHDHRIDDFINLLEEIFDIYSRLQKEAAASGNSELQVDLSDKMSDLAGWWDQYGSMDVGGLESFSGNEAWESAAVVSTALAAWNKAGTSAGDVAFWSKHVDRFKSTKAFVLLAEALLDQQDPVASMALMMHWLSNAEKIPLTEGDYSFHSIALRWMEQLWKTPKNEEEEETKSTPRQRSIKKVPPLPNLERWKLTRKFFDYIEANADSYWSVPTLELDDEMFEGTGSGKKVKKKKRKKSEFDLGLYDAGTDDEEDIFDIPYKDKPRKGNSNEFDTSDSIYNAAYEDVTYHDTTDDGIDDNMMDAPAPPGYNDGDDFEIVDETERISERLTFIVTMSKLWKFVAEKIAALSRPVEKQLPIAPELTAPEIVAEIEQNADMWLNQVRTYGKGLEDLLQRTSDYKVPPPRGTSDSLLEYDRHRGTKEILLDRIVWTHVEVRDVKMILESFLGEKYWQGVFDAWEQAVLEINYTIFQGDVKTVKKRWSGMLSVLSKETILYVPTSRGGSAAAIVRCRCIQQAIMRLMEYAPRLGLLAEAFEILETIQIMEEVNTITPGAITEFDRLVETATRAITKCVAMSAKTWKMNRNPQREAEAQDAALVEYMEQIIEHLLSSWLSHSRQIRISPIESSIDRSYWD